MRVQYFGYEMAEHSHFNNEVTTAKLLTEKIVIRQSNFFKTITTKHTVVRVLKATKQVN